MAIRLGNFVENKTIKSIKENIERNVKLETIIELIDNMDKHVQLCNDIFDTYQYIKRIDKGFADKLWASLYRNRFADININSYWSWSVGYSSYILISRYGVSVYNQSIRQTLMDYYNLDEKDIYRGKVLLSDYIDDFNVSDIIIDKMLKELTTLFVNFEEYANDFFESVSSYKIVEK